MIQLTAQTHILLATQPADFRCGIDGLAAICRSRLASDPRSGSLFVFINRSKTMIRTLVYDGTGFWLMTKRLSQGKFKDWPTAGAPMNAVAAKYLRALLLGSGIDPSWEKVGTHKTPQGDHNC
ncbi:MAG: transposase [Phenylobacterium sp.]|jgi:transposase